MADRPAVLIVEDHRETRTFLQMALDQRFTIHTASSAAEALEKSEGDDYDLLLIDIALGGEIDGIELVRRLRREPEFADTPMIAMTAHQLRENRSYYLERGFDEYLQKPFFPEDLLATIDRLLDDFSSDNERQPRT